MYAGNSAAWKLSFAYTVTCCYAVLRSSCLKLFCLRCLIELMLTHNLAYMYNAAISELYLVQISGLLGTSSLINTHCSSSYIKTLLIAQDTAADCCTMQLPEVS